jgi:serralysin
MKIKLGNHAGEYVADQAGAKYILKAGAAMSNAAGRAIDAEDDAAGKSFVINGTVDGATIGMTVGDALQLATSQKLVVGQTGVINANGTAVDFFGDDSHLVNRGFIRSSNDDEFGIYAEGRGVSITNAGTIIGHKGIYAKGDNVMFTNTGTISGNFAGVDFDGGAADSGRLVNSGTIVGKISSVTGSAGVETIVNSGLLLGSVSLSSGDDVFRNRGGDVMGIVYGGFGDDTFYVDKASLKLTDGVGQGYDTVKSSVSWVLGENFERGILTGRKDIDLTGNNDANSLSGNRGDNTIDGQAGMDFLSGGGGDDVLTGGADFDTFIMRRGSDHDTITDFELGTDKISLSEYQGVDGIEDISIKKSGVDTLITLGKGDSVTIVGIDPSLLMESDFVF